MNDKLQLLYDIVYIEYNKSVLILSKNILGLILKSYAAVIIVNLNILLKKIKNSITKEINKLTGVKFYLQVSIVFGMKGI